MKRFHNYFFGRKFTLCTDHKPLLSLFHEQRAIPSQASAQIQHWALSLAVYPYAILFKSTANHGNADAMSQLPLPGSGEREPPVPAETILLMEHMDRSPVAAHQIRQWTNRDPLLSRVVHQVQKGWPEHCAAEELKPFASRSTELSVQDGCLLWGIRVVVPPKARSKFLQSGTVVIQGYHV